MHQEMQAASRIQKKQEHRFSPRGSREEHSATNTVILAP